MIPRALKNESLGSIHPDTYSVFVTDGDINIWSMQYDTVACASGGVTFDSRFYMIVEDLYMLEDH